jgi:hypothetical protein
MWTTEDGCMFGSHCIPYWAGEIPYNYPKAKMPSPQRSERRIELPLAMIFVWSHPHALMELGGVTPYYFDYHTYPVIDVQDPHPRCTHVDIRAIRDYAHKRVLSISTLEHIRPVQAAIETVQLICNTAEHYMLTIPVGFTPQLDVALRTIDPARHTYVLARNNAHNDWVVATDARNYEYGKPFPYANAIQVLTDQPMEQLCHWDAFAISSGTPPRTSKTSAGA